MIFIFIFLVSKAKPWPLCFPHSSYFSILSRSRLFIFSNEPKINKLKENILVLWFKSIIRWLMENNLIVTQDSKYIRQQPSRLPDQGFRDNSTFNIVMDLCYNQLIENITIRRQDLTRREVTDTSISIWSDWITWQIHCFLGSRLQEAWDLLCFWHLYFSVGCHSSCQPQWR